MRVPEEGGRGREVYVLLNNIKVTSKRMGLPCPNPYIGYHRVMKIALRTARFVDLY